MRKRKKVSKTKIEGWKRDLSRIACEINAMEAPNDVVDGLRKKCVENLRKAENDVYMMILNPYFKEDRETYMYAIFIADPDIPHLLYIESEETAKDFKSKREAIQRIIEFDGKFWMHDEKKHAKDICLLGVTKRNGRVLHPNTDKMRTKADKFLTRCIKQMEEENG